MLPAPSFFLKEGFIPLFREGSCWRCSDFCSFENYRLCIIPQCG